MSNMDNPQQPFILPDGSIGVRSAEFDEDGKLIPDPTWIEYLKEARLGKQYDETLIEGPMPMVINLGEFFSDPTGAIGYATVYKMNDGRKRISILLTAEASESLGKMINVFDLKGIGFAGIKKKGGEQQ